MWWGRIQWDGQFTHLHFTDSGTPLLCQVHLLAVISQILQHNEGWRQRTGALSEDSTEGLSFKPCIPAENWSADFLSASFQPPLTPTPQPCHTLHSNCENERDITNGTDYVLCTKCQHFVMQKKKKRLKTTKQGGAYNRDGSRHVCWIKKKEKRLNYVGRNI